MFITAAYCMTAKGVLSHYSSHVWPLRAQADDRFSERARVVPEAG